MEKRQRGRERERLRRGEKAGTRSHLSLLSRCWRQSRQTLRRPLQRWWWRRFGSRFVPRRTRFVIFKAEHRQAFFFVGETARSCIVTAILFFTNLSIFIAAPLLAFSSRPCTFSTLPLFSIQLSLRSLVYCRRRMRHVKSMGKRLNFSHGSCQDQLCNVRNFLRRILCWKLFLTISVIFLLLESEGTNRMLRVYDLFDVLLISRRNILPMLSVRQNTSLLRNSKSLIIFSFTFFALAFTPLFFFFYTLFYLIFLPQSSSYSLEGNALYLLYNPLSVLFLIL